MSTSCESCNNYEYNEEYEYFECLMDLDEDEMGRFIASAVTSCSYYQFRDEYRIVRKQI